MSAARNERRRLDKLRAHYAKMNAGCPDEIMGLVREHIRDALAGKEYRRGETFSDLMRQHGEKAFAVARESGFELIVDLPDNTPEAMRKSQMYLVMRRQKTLH